MSCRTTPAGSAFTSFYRLQGASDGISDVATLSTFHSLRRVFQNMNPEYTWARRNVTREGYLASIESLRRSINNSDLSEARKASLLARLDAAAAADPIPDESTIYAIQNLSGEIRGRAHRLRTFLTDYAASTGCTFEEAKAHFTELENSIDRARDAADPDTYTEENQTMVRNIGLTTEAGTVHAVVMMRQERQMVAERLIEGRPPRIIREPLTSEGNAPVEDGTPMILDAGYDRRNNRLDVTIREADGTTRQQAYCNISSYEYDYLTGAENPTEYWSRNIRGRNYHNYDSVEEELFQSISPRCSVCGQFANNTHACPVSLRENLTTYDMSVYRTPTSGQSVLIPFTNADGAPRSSQVRVTLPQAGVVRPTIRNNSVAIENIREYVSGYDTETNRMIGGQVTGNVAIMRDATTGELSYNSEGLQCTCSVYRRNYHCTHVDNYIAAVRARITPPSSPARARASMTEEERIALAAANQRLAEAAAASDWTRNEATLAEVRKTWQESEKTYSTDFEAFKEDYNKSLEAIASKNGSPAIPYMKENALGGLATRESGQAFGMEIEYEFPRGTDTREANRKIGEALYAAGITSTDSQQGYHASIRNGYKDVHTDPETGKGTWSFERDGSVNGGEIVSPGMYDEPETWQKLEKVVEILRENGAIPSTKAGAHVHVGTQYFQGDPQKYGQLASLVNQHEDVLFRLAEDPARGKHRQGGYTTPLPTAEPSGGWATVSEIRSWQSGRTRVLNFTNVGDEPGHASHPEFRIFDSTLNAGAMQSQIKLAVALTAAAARTAGQATPAPKEPIGAHAKRQAARGTRRRMSDDELKEDTATFRSLMDTIFTRKEDKAQMTALFAATKWNKPDRGNQNLQEREAIAAQRAHEAQS